jgi:hypothetical protein
MSEGARISVSKGGRLVRFTVSRQQAAALRKLGRYGIIGRNATDCAKTCLMWALIERHCEALPLFPDPGEDQ